MQCEGKEGLWWRPGSRPISLRGLEIIEISVQVLGRRSSQCNLMFRLVRKGIV